MAGLSTLPAGSYTSGRRQLNLDELNSIASPDGQAQLQLVMRQTPVTSLPNQNLIWNNLSSNKQLQALLATATRAASLNSNHCTDLASPFNWLQAPTKLDLPGKSPLQSPVVDYNWTTLSDHKLHPMTIPSPKRDPSSNEHAAAPVFSPCNDRQSCMPLSLSASPVSSTSSSRSSTESINLTMTKTNSTPKCTWITDAKMPSSKRQGGPLEATTCSPSSISSDVDFLGLGEASNASDGLMDPRVDRRARKKDQNRRAAYNYRRKKMEERDRMIEEEARLVHKHVRLAGQIAKLEKRISMIISARANRVLNKHGQLVYYSCPVCLKHCSEDIDTLRKHIKAQHFHQKTLSDSSQLARSQKYDLRSSSPNVTQTSRKGQSELLEDNNDLEYDSCIDSDETNNFGNTDLYNACDDKFVNRTSLDGDDYNNIKNNLSF